jgi:hypothetical protein
MKGLNLSAILTTTKFLLICLFFTSCSKAKEEKIEPQISYIVPKAKLKQLPSCFASLSENEKKEDWGKEYFIGQKLAKKFDLYRAVTAFKRAEILIPGYLKDRLHEIQYFTVLSYYLGEKYPELIEAFEDSDLIHVDSSFSAYRDLLLILHESFIKLGREEKASYVLKLIDENDKNLGQILKVSHAVSDYNRSSLAKINEESSVGAETKKFLSSYDLGKKSETKAQVYNAIFPGAGYLYLGQKQAAATAFFLNALTSYAAYHFYHTGNVAAGLLFTSIETGWYFGGITGAKESAKLYNERLYENGAKPILQKHELYPVLNLTHSF